MKSSTLLAHHDRLLFQRAYPVDAAELAHADRELKRIVAFMRARRGRYPASLDHAGLPYVSQVARFSHDCVRWLSSHPHCTVAFEEFADATLDLNTVLRLTLPTIERSETNAALGNADLLEVLGVSRRRYLAFLIAELGRLDDSPFVKDQLYDALGVVVRITPTHREFSTAFNRLPVDAPFFHAERITPFDATALMNSALPTARRLGAVARNHVVRVIRTTMTLTSRETDPVSYLDERSLRLFDLERGVSVAIFGMTHDRQLALESYVGFAAFKNGMPVSYGGAWVLGERADFGMNIFEPYRGGESGYLMCQLLRVYRQTFGVRYFEVDAQQFGLDNPEGIRSGAFWFYYRYGFRPTDAALERFARREKARLTARAGARSTRRTLLALTGSNVALNFGGGVPQTLADITTRVTQLVTRRYAGDRPAAEQDCINHALAAGVRRPRDRDQRAALAELALCARALGALDQPRARLLNLMVKAKPHDVYEYQRLLTAFLQLYRAPNR